jgi:hypothetical protein
MPQNEFCGYENSAFQAKNTLEYRNPSQWKPSIHRLTFAWKAELLPLFKWISTPAKKNKQNENS